MPPRGRGRGRDMRPVRPHASSGARETYEGLITLGGGKCGCGLRGGAARCFCGELASYCGEWVRGKCHGRGSAQQGECCTPAVTGTYVCADGNTYVGEYAYNLQHGCGVNRWPNGDRYEGEYARGKMHGLGRYVLASGGGYEGRWADDKEHGRGLKTFVNDRRGRLRFEGEWVEGKEHGMMVYTSGVVLEGKWVDTKPHGKGTVTTPDGDSYEVAWLGEVMSALEGQCDVNGRLLSSVGASFASERPLASDDPTTSSPPPAVRPVARHLLFVPCLLQLDFPGKQELCTEAERRGRAYAAGKSAALEWREAAALALYTSDAPEFHRLFRCAVNPVGSNGSLSAFVPLLQLIWSALDRLEHRHGVVHYASSLSPRWDACRRLDPAVPRELLMSEVFPPRSVQRTRPSTPRSPVHPSSCTAGPSVSPTATTQTCDCDDDTAVSRNSV